MRRSLVLIAACAALGCGRFGYDPRASSDGGDGAGDAGPRWTSTPTRLEDPTTQQFGGGYGSALAVDGDLLIVGEPDDGTTWGGGAFAYRITGATANHVASFGIATPIPDEFYLYGLSVAVDGNTVVIGTETSVLPNDGTDGYVYIYELDSGTGLWGQGCNGDSPPMCFENLRLQTTDEQRAVWFFGWSIAIDGDTILTSAWEHSETPSIYTSSGRAYVYQRNGATWGTSCSGTTTPICLENQKLEPSTLMANDQFGGWLELDGDTMLASNYSGQGPTYVFKKNGSVWGTACSGNPPLCFEDQAIPPTSGDYLGDALTKDGNRFVSFSEDGGGGHVFEFDGASWVETALILPEDESNGFTACSALLRGDLLVVGVCADDEILMNSGAVYVFERSGTEWTQVVKLKAPTPQEDSSFGGAVAMNDDGLLFVGASREDAERTGQGAVYIFER